MHRAALLCLVACSGHAGPSSPDAGGDADPGVPHVVAVTPFDGWLHEAIRIELDRAVTIEGVTASATCAGAPVAASVAPDRDDPAAIVVTLDPAARALGALAVHVAGQVADADGHTGAIAVDLEGDAPAWSAPAVALDTGPAEATPAIAVAPDGGVIAAWPAAQRVVVAELDRGRWRALGDPLGAGAASSVALALDGSGAPVVGWVEAGVAEVARWNGGAWAQLASPGPAGALALAGGSPVVAARFGAEADVSELAPDDSWQAIGAVALPAAVVGEPQLAADRDRVALAWIDAGDQLRTARYRDGAWSALVPLPLGAPASGFDRVSVAARGDAIAVAWDQWAGSFAVLAASATGDATALAQLGRPLDVALDDDAVAPAIALDASGAPIVAWTELSGTAQRGAIARWNGSAWAIVGGPSWLADPSAAPSRAALALGPGDAPVVATSQRGAIVVARFNGPAVAGDGIARRASLAGCAIDPSAPPAWLSQTGCFAIATPGRPTPHPGLVPYGIGVELWSDGAKKRRWLGVPDGQAMTVSATGAWTPPLGGFVVKEFAIDTTPGDPSTRRAIETRFLVRDAAGYHGVSYRWTLDGTDATLQPDAEQTFDWPMDDGSVHPHFYPSRSDCLECHNPTYGPLLGPRAPQLAGWFDYGGVIADQPSTLADLGVGPAQTAAPFASPEDPSQPVELRVRGYMAANCAHCHNPSDVAIHDLRYATPLAQTNLCPDIVPGDPAASKVYQLVSSRPGMPPLGTLAIDPLAVGLLGGWISSMTSCP